MSDDPRLGELFGAARRQDENAAPRFRELLQRSRRPSDRVYRVRVARTILAAVMVVLAVTVVYLRRTAPASPPATQPFLSNVRWEGPTDFLLETPGGELFQSTPRIGVPPPLDYRPPEPQKGTRT